MRNLHSQFYLFIWFIIGKIFDQLINTWNSFSIKFSNNAVCFQTCFISSSTFCYLFYKNSCRNAIHLNCLRTYRRTFDSKYTMFRIIQFISWCLIHQILKNVSHVWDCNCITHTFYFSRSKFCRVDTNNLAFHIQKSTATVTRVDSRICLDQVYTVTAVITSICYCVIVRIHSAVLGTYDTGCNRLSISKGISNGDHALTNL